MYPVLFKIGPINIYSYGTMVALGFSAAIFLACRRARVFQLKREDVADLSILALVSGIVGARLLYIFFNLSHYLANPLEIFNLSKGGLVWYGGFLAGLAAVAWYARAKEMPFWDVADLFAPYIALAQATGRLGCFLNGCCFGREAHPSYPFGVVFPGSAILRHPAQLYAAALLIALFLLLRSRQDKRRFQGEIFLGYCMLYSSKRFFLEFVRGDNVRLALNLTVYQYASIAILAVSATIFILKFLKWEPRNLSLR